MRVFKIKKYHSNIVIKFSGECLLFSCGTMFPTLDMLQFSVIWAERAGRNYLAELAEVETGPHQGRKCDQADESDG